MLPHSRVNTWPTEMTLIQSHDSVVSHPEFQHWAKKTRPVVCTLKPHARSSDVRQNMIIEQMFKGLEKMIMGSRTVSLIFTSNTSILTPSTSTSSHPGRYPQEPKPTTSYSPTSQITASSEPSSPSQGSLKCLNPFQGFLPFQFPDPRPRYRQATL